MKIITNNVPRDVHDDWDQAGEQNDSYVMYKGEKYPLGGFRVHVPVSTNREHTFRKEGWDGYISDTFFSGILLKWVPVLIGNRSLWGGSIHDGR